MDRPSKDDIALWQSSPVTKYLLNILEENLSVIKDGWAEADYVSEDALTTIQSNSSAQGTAYALIQVIEEIRGLASDD